MKFTLTKSLAILERTPDVLQSLMTGLSNEWTSVNEGPETWSVHDIIGHFVYIEKANWMTRAQIILFDSSKQFPLLNPLGHLEECKNKNIDELLIEFKILRQTSVKDLQSFSLNESDFAKTADHPALGTVSLSQLLSAWVVHDLSHLAQISRVMSKQYKDAVGPFSEYLRLLKYN
jgi:hypothetical protein